MDQQRNIRIGQILISVLIAVTTFVIGYYLGNLVGSSNSAESIEVTTNTATTSSKQQTKSSNCPEKNAKVKEINKSMKLENGLEITLEKVAYFCLKDAQFGPSDPVISLRLFLNLKNTSTDNIFLAESGFKLKDTDNYNHSIGPEGAGGPPQRIYDQELKAGEEARGIIASTFHQNKLQPDFKLYYETMFIAFKVSTQDVVVGNTQTL